MKNTYSIRQFKYCTLLSTILLLVLSTNAFAQVEKTFTQRTSSKALQKYVKEGSNGKIYNLRGDFKMAGNTNLTLVNYSNDGSNADNMEYVDIDLDSTTVNSSSSYLDIPNDACTEIVYAGLYWSGRANTGDMSFNVTGTVQTGISSTTTQTVNMTNGSKSLDHTHVTIDRAGTAATQTTTANYYPVHTVVIGSKEFEFTIHNDGTITKRERLNGGAWSPSVAVSISNTDTSDVSTTTNDPNWNRDSNLDHSDPINSNQKFCYRGYRRTVTETTAGRKIYTLATSIVYNYNGVNYTISQIASYFRSQRTRTEIRHIRRTRNLNQLCDGSDSNYDNNNNNYYKVSQGAWSTTGYNATQNQFRDASDNYVTVQGPQSTYTTANYNKSLSKNIVKLKHETGDYFNVTALTADIQYPSGGNFSNMYAAYADVTDSIRKYGAGNYFVADLATTAGNSDNTGHFGGWGLVVIYANPDMKWRDITVFDGYAHVAGSTTVSHQLPISGFQAAQSGLVNVDIGVMAGEGDRDISGDYFQVLGRGGTATDETHYKDLGNSGEIGGFFNSNIDTGSARARNLVNNTGIDIQRISLPNQTKVYTAQTGSSNYIIGNSATSTTFKYGSTQDTYIIYNLVFAVDAYVPEALPISMATEIITKGTSSAPSRVIDDRVEITDYMRTLQPGDTLKMQMKIINPGNERVLNANIDLRIPKELEYVPGTLNMTLDTSTGVGLIGTTAVAEVTAFQTPVWTANAPDPANPSFYTGGLISWTLGTIPRQTPNPDPFDIQAMAIMEYTLVVTEECDYLKYSNATCMVSPKLSGGIEGNGENSGASMADKGFITGVINEDCRQYKTGTLDFEVPVNEDYLTTKCNAGDVIKDVELVYPCGGVTVSGNEFNVNMDDFLYKTDAELIADGDNSTNPGDIIRRYPAGTKFYHNVPSIGTPTPIDLSSSSVSVTVENNNGIHSGLLYAVIPDHQTTTTGPYFCYYIVTIIIDTTVKKPVVPTSAVKSLSLIHISEPTRPY